MLSIERGGAVLPHAIHGHVKAHGLIMSEADANQAQIMEVDSEFSAPELGDERCASLDPLEGTERMLHEDQSTAPPSKPEARILAPESSTAQPSPSDVTPELASQPGVENSAVELPSEAELRRRLDILCVGCNGEPRGSCGRVPGLRATNTLIKHVINVVFAFFVERLALRCAS